MLKVVERPARLDRFLAESFPEFSRTRLATLVHETVVLVDGKPARSSHKLLPGMVVELELPTAKAPHSLLPAAIDLEILFEDEAMLVVNKPRGLATHPAASLKEPSLVNALLARGGALSGGTAAYRPGIVHRLDKETTGLLLIAKTEQAHNELSRQIADKSAERRYAGVVIGQPELERFDIDAPIARDQKYRLRMAIDQKGKQALTHVRRLKTEAHQTLIAVRLSTGRTHQIRVHMHGVGHPVLGDSLYAPEGGREFSLQLHAAMLAFNHPITQVRQAIFCPPPFDFMMREAVTETSLLSV